MFEIRLIDHIGKKHVRNFGDVEVDLNQFIVHAIHPETKKSLHVGYIGKAANSPFNPIVTFGGSLDNQLRTNVIEAYQKTGRVAGTKTVNPPPDVEEIETEDDD